MTHPMPSGRFKSLIRTPGRAAFTIVEVLVVVGIIVVLVAILVPSLEVAMEHGRTAKCMSQLRNIGMAFRAYQSDHKSVGHPRRDGNRWWTDATAATTDPITGETIAEGEESRYVDASDTTSYWGVAYVQWGAQRDNYSCPSASDMYSHATDARWTERFADGHRFATYGFNGPQRYRNLDTTFWSPWFARSNSSTSDANPATLIKNAAETLLAFDSYEHMPEGEDDIPPTMGPDIQDSQWKQATQILQYIRHRRGTAMLWGDAHVSHYQSPEGVFGENNYRKHWYVRARNNLSQPK